MKPVWNTETVLTDHNWGQETVRDLRCILLNLSSSDVENSVIGEGGDNTSRGPVCHIMDLYLIRCSQRVPLYRTSLVRQT